MTFIEFLKALYPDGLLAIAVVIGAFFVGSRISSALKKSTEYTPLSEEELDKLRKD